PWCHGAHRTVTSPPVGLRKNSSSRSVRSGTASGKVLAKKPPTASRATSWSKPGAPWKGRKRVQVNDRSRFGSAIIMNPPRGQMCKIGRAHVELQSPYDLVCRLLLEKKNK